MSFYAGTPLTRNSTVADKPRDIFYMQWRGWSPSLKQTHPSNNTMPTLRVKPRGALPLRWGRGLPLTTPSPCVTMPHLVVNRQKIGAGRWRIWTSQANPSDVLRCRKILARHRLDSWSAALAACGTSASNLYCVWWCTKRCTDWPLHIYASSAQVPALKVELGRLLAATLQFSGRGQSSADVHSSSQVRRHGTGCHAPFATLRPWTVTRRRWRHFSSLLTFNFPFLILILLHALYKQLCTAPLNRLPCYGALEVIVTLLLLYYYLFLLHYLAAKLLVSK